MLSEMLQLMGEMLLLMVTGLVIRQIGIVTNEGRKCLTDLILYVILPCNIVRAFVNETDSVAGIGSALGLVLLISVLIQILCTIIGYVCYRMMNEGEKQVFQYATVCSNAGFMGNPLTEAVFGDMGLLYASIYLIPQRIVMWTAGVSYFNRGSNRKGLLKKVLVHPCMIAVYNGLFLMLTGIPLPGFMDKTVSALSSCTTAMTMVYIGTILSDVDWKTIVTGKQLYFSVMRLVIIPLIVWLPCRFLHVDPLITGVSVFLAAMPAGGDRRRDYRAGMGALTRRHLRRPGMSGTMTAHLRRCSLLSEILRRRQRSALPPFHSCVPHRCSSHCRRHRNIPAESD